ncbi:MAG TPA: alpha/beta hydrolase [Bacilli bacterium]|nr:alpha/beta hydrolase [Bacilli bacterium]
MDKQIITVYEENSTLLGYAWKNEKIEGHIVIVSGMEEYAARYERLALFLCENHFDVYSLDFFGQGLNVQKGSNSLGAVPEKAFKIYVEAIRSMIRKLSSSDGKPIYIIAHSMGSFIAQKVVQNPDLPVKGLVLSGSNGPDISFKLGSFLSFVLINKRNWNKKAVFFNNLAFGGYAKAVPGAKTKFDWLSYNEENVKNYIADLYCGYGSTNGFYHEFMHFLAHLYSTKGLRQVEKDLPILLIAGAEDPVGHNGKGVEKLNNLYHRHKLNGVTKIIYHHMRHEIFNEKDYLLVYQDVLSFIKKI